MISFLTELIVRLVSFFSFFFFFFLVRIKVRGRLVRSIIQFMHLISVHFWTYNFSGVSLQKASELFPFLTGLFL